MRRPDIERGGIMGCGVKRYDRILKAAQRYEKPMVRFLRDMIALESESTMEKLVIERVQKEMRKVGFDEIRIDRMGNILGRIGKGKRIIAMDAHVDVVGSGPREEWAFDPFKGKLENGVVYGRGASDQKGGMASLVYAARVIKDLDLVGDYSLYVVGSIQEEGCEGLCWRHIINDEKLVPECVVITEPSNLEIRVGQKGKIELAVRTFGVSSHGSAPWRGKNAVYMMAKVIGEIERLNERLAYHKRFGRGTIAVTYVECTTPSLCAVPGEAHIHIDRRLTEGETMKEAIREVEEAVRRTGLKKSEFDVRVATYDEPSYTGLRRETEMRFPGWNLGLEHPLAKAAVKTFERVFARKPKIGRWAFSTNGVATMGVFGIPTIGFGPANETLAHTIDDQVPVAHLAKAAAFYAFFPTVYCETTKAVGGRSND
jgi:putative selenium metabolism hydrolase